MGTIAWRALGRARSSPHRLLRELSNARFLALLLGCAVLLLLAGNALPSPGAAPGGRGVGGLGHRGTRVISKTVDSTRDASVYTELIIDSRGGTTRVTRDQGGAMQVTLTDGSEGEAVGSGFAAATAVNQAHAMGRLGTLSGERLLGADGSAASGGTTLEGRAALDAAAGAAAGALRFAAASAASPSRAVSKALAAARAEIARRFPGLPEDFDPETYLSYYPELQAQGVRSPDDARQHFLAKGRAEGRLGAPLRVIMRYTACTGLINQHYSHIAALTLAAELGAEAVLPPAACRDSFGHYFSTFREKNEVVWSPAPLESLLDVDYLAKYWAERGMEVRLAPALTPFPDLTAPELAYPAYDEPGVDPRAVVRLDNVYARNIEIRELVDMARTAVLDRAHQLAREARQEVDGTGGGAARGAAAREAQGTRTLAQANDSGSAGKNANAHTGNVANARVNAVNGTASSRRRLQSLVEDDLDELFALEAATLASRGLQAASRKLDPGHRRHGDEEPKDESSAGVAEKKGGANAALDASNADASNAAENKESGDGAASGASSTALSGASSLSALSSLASSSRYTSLSSTSTLPSALFEGSRPQPAVLVRAGSLGSSRLRASVEASMSMRRGSAAGFRARAASVSEEVPSAKARRLQSSTPVRYVVLDLPCTFFMLRTLDDLPLVGEVTRSLRFPPSVHALAARIVEGVTERGARDFNGAHLRIEKDARDWAMILGGPQVVWRRYIETMRLAGQDSKTPLYAATGVLTYGADVEMSRTVSYLLHMGVCSEVLHKELYVRKEDLDALNSEQKALVDLLVLARSKVFVGFGSSTFSFFLREYRALAGISRKRSVLVDSALIGTDSLFANAGTVV